MKRIIGIVCEYNPFHNGHIYQINKIKETFVDSIIVICMSSSFTQRGELSLLNKFDKTKVALNNNIDIVIELPYLFSTQSADVFGEYSVKLLNELKIDTLVFGTENNNIENIIKSADIQLNNKEFDIFVKKYMNEGNNYPTSLNKALKELNVEEIKTPNDLLALSYIKAIKKNNFNIEPFNIKRTNDFHDIDSTSTIVSASNIRNKILNKESIKDQVPLEVYNILKSKSINNKYFELLKYKIISEKDLSKYVDVDEGIDFRIKNVINKSNTLEELIDNIKSKRYTKAKVSRMLNHIFCSFTKEENIHNLEYIRILGFSNNGQKYLNSIKKDIKLPILNKYDTRYNNLNIEKRITDLYSIIYDDISNEEIKNKPIKNSN